MGGLTPEGLGSLFATYNAPGYAMARFLATFIFNLFNQGWSESFYTRDASIDAARLDIVEIGQARARLLPRSVLFTAARLSDVAIVGDSYVTSDSQLWEKVNLPPDVTNTALETRLQVQGTNWRTYWLRGLPDSWINRDVDSGKFIYNEPFYTLYRNYFDLLVTKQIAVKAIDKPGSIETQPIRKIQSITAGAVAGTTVIVIDPFNPSLAVNSYVRIRRLTGGIAGLNGKWVVTSVNADEGSITVPFNIATMATLFGPDNYINGYVYSLTQKFIQVTSWQALDIRTRQTGRPFGQPRGRRSARR